MATRPMKKIACYLNVRHGIGIIECSLTIHEEGEYGLSVVGALYPFADGIVEYFEEQPMIDNKSAFAVNQYDENVRKVIPHYDEIYEQIFSVITTYCGDKPLAVLDTGCGTGDFGVMALNRLNLTELVLCDPSEKMLADARKKLVNQGCEYHCIGSEKLEFSNRFDIVTAIQSHHYFDRATREAAVKNCFNALKPGGIFICFENTAPFTERGKDLLLKRIEAFGLAAGRTPDEVRSHSARYNTEYFPITIKEHLELLDKTGFAACELFWHSYMQSGFYAIKG